MKIKNRIFFPAAAKHIGVTSEIQEVCLMLLIQAVARIINQGRQTCKKLRLESNRQLTSGKTNTGKECMFHCPPQPLGIPDTSKGQTKSSTLGSESHNTPHKISPSSVVRITGPMYLEGAKELGFLWSVL